MLFGPNTHSKYRIEWKEIPPEAKEEITRLIPDHYNFDEIDKDNIFQIDEWEKMSNNFKVKVRSGGKWIDVLFRKHIQLKDKESISVLDKIFGFLRKQNVPIPSIILTKDGQTTFKEKENFYVMFEFIEGNHYRGTIEELKEVARQIAYFHRALKKIPFVEDIKKKPLLLFPWSVDGWNKLFEAAEKKEKEIDTHFKENKEFIMEEAGRVEEALEKNPQLRKQFIHCDLHPQNTIFDNGRLVAILDFEGVRTGELCRDVANACHRFVRQFVVFQGKNWQETLAEGLRLFVGEYAKVNSFSQEEISLIPIFTRDELLRKLFKDLNLHYFEGYSKNVEGGELNKKLTLLKEASIIGENL